MDLKRPKPEFTQKSVNQAEGAVEQAGELADSNLRELDAAADAFRVRTLELQKKAIEMAQTNLNASFDFFRRALAVQNPADVFALNQEFARDQLAAYSKQASELTELSFAVAKETSKPLQEGLKKTWSGISEKMAA